MSATPSSDWIAERATFRLPKNFTVNNINIQVDKSTLLCMYIVGKLYTTSTFGTTMRAFIEWHVLERKRQFADEHVNSCCIEERNVKFWNCGSHTNDWELKYTYNNTHRKSSPRRQNILRKNIISEVKMQMLIILNYMSTFLI
jgi:hypothetical protein